MEQTMDDTLSNPGHRLLTPPPPLHAMPRSKTGRKPQRSSPLAGPAVSLDDGEDITSRLRVASSPSLTRDFNNTLLSATPRQAVSSGLPRPKSMYSTHSLHPQSFSPQARSCESLGDPKQLIRPVSAVLPLTTTQVYFSNRHSSGPETSRDFHRGEQTYYNRPRPFTSPTSKHHAPPPTRPLELPTIIVNDFQTPTPPLATSTVTTIPKDNSWYTANAYDETPRFSRLAAGSVVMPVSAKEYNRCSGNRSLCDLTCDSGDSPTTNAANRNRRSFLMGSLASTLKLTRSNPNLASSDQQFAQTPSPSSSVSSRSSNTFDSDSSPAPSATSTFSPTSSLYRTRRSSFTDSSSSICTPSSRTSINEETIQESSSPTVGHGKVIQQTEKTPSIAGKDRSKNVLVSEKSRRSGTFRRFIKLFVST